MFAFLCAILTGCGRKPASSPTESLRAAASNFWIAALTAERSGDHLHLTVTVSVRNRILAPLTLTPPAAQLWIGKDKPAAPFIAPGLEPSVIAPGAESDAVTHWWLPASDLSGSMELEIFGVRQAVKSAGAFDIESLPEGRTVGLLIPQWRAP